MRYNLIHSRWRRYAAGMPLIIPVCCIAVLSCSVSPRFRSGERQAAPASSLPVNTDRVQIGIASYYGAKYHGRATASGEIFDMYQISAAHRDLPLGTRVRVTNIRNGRSLELIINDRGPFIKGRILDVSFKAAEELDFVTAGTTTVRIEVLERGPGD